MTKIKPMLNGLASDLDSVEPAALNEYFGVWCIEQIRFDQMLNHVQSINVEAHLKVHSDHRMIEKQATDRDRGYAMDRPGIARINLTGPMMKYRASLSNNASTVAVRRALSNAVNDPEVSNIVIKFDTPGGTVSGTQDLASAISSAKSKKPVFGFAEDLTASAGYWCLAQCTEAYANNDTALIGSIGVFSVVTDASKAAESLGIKVHVIRAGEFKGAGVLGTAITPEQIAEYQRIIDSLNENFLLGVASGRQVDLSVIRDQWADGRVHPAKVAQDMRMIDGVMSYAALMDHIESRSQRGRKNAMPTDQQTNNDAPATLQELEKALPGAESNFVLGALRNGLTVSQAMSSYIAHQNEKISKADDEKKSAVEKALAEEKAKAEEEAAARNATAGVKPIVADMNANPETGGSPGAQFNQLVVAQIERGVDRAQAIRNVSRANPQLHREYLLATQTSPKNRRILTERFGDVAAKENQPA